MCIYGMYKNGTDEPICRAGIEIQTKRTDLWAQPEKKRVEQTKRVALRRRKALEKEMATHSSILAWSIPWTEEPGRPWSIGS